MKKFSEIIGEQQTSYITEANDKGASLADKLLAQPIPKQPDYMVEDNPKMAQLADTFIKLINKRCGWDAYTFPSIKKIGDVQTVVVVNKKAEGSRNHSNPKRDKCCSPLFSQFQRNRHKSGGGIYRILKKYGYCEDV